MDQDDLYKEHQSPYNCVNKNYLNKFRSNFLYIKLRDIDGTVFKNAIEVII